MCQLILDLETLFMRRSWFYAAFISVCAFFFLAGTFPIQAQDGGALPSVGLLGNSASSDAPADSASEAKNVPVEIRSLEEGKVAIIVNLDGKTLESLKEPSDPAAISSEFLVPDAANEVKISQIRAAICGFWTSLKSGCWENMDKIILFMFGLILTWGAATLLNFLCERILFKKIVSRTKTRADDYVYRALKPPIFALFWCLGIFLSALSFWDQLGFSQRLIFLLLAVDVTWLLYRLIGALDSIICMYFRGKKRVFNKLIFDAVRKTLRVALILFAFCIIGQTILGLNISAILAAAGVFGLAAAFAVKDTLSNFLSSFMMLFDNSFQMGDRIRTKNIDGEVEAVDFRSTRIRAPNGNLFSVPNSILGAEIVENVSQRPGIRYDFDLTLTYETTPSQMERALALLQTLISDEVRFLQQTEKKLVIFSGFGDWALQIHVTTWFNTRNFYVSEQWKNELNFEILRRFTQEGLEFAYPTNSVILQRDEKESAKTKENE